ncbi:Rhox homeobox family member 1 [Cricetulus griseus]|uniref:Rhox homeobox family member 1 n=1 Tax=Cricetulus griseus TaxID=10029 RepID=G3IKX4_CRIGR|nr:Rhox homeobox family member 1 [Cricetulus griseus]
MEHLLNYNDNFYYLLQDSVEGSSPLPEQGAAAQRDVKISEGALSLDSSENQQDNQSLGGYESPSNNPGPERDQSTQEPIELRPEELALELAEVPRRRLRRRQIDFHFTHWQVQEMETVFRETQYPDVLTRRVLARNMNVPEVKVKDFSGQCLSLLTLYLIPGKNILEEGKCEQD